MSDEQNKELDQELEELKALLSDPDDNTEEFSLDDILAENGVEIQAEAEAAPAEMPEEAPAEAPVQEAPAPAKKKKQTRRTVIYYSLMTVFVGVFIFCAIYIARYWVSSIQRNNFYNDMASQVEQLRGEHATTDPNKGTLPGGATQPSGGGEEEGGVLPEYKPWYERNNDMVGWIKIDVGYSHETDSKDKYIDLPVMQTPDNPEYYLHRDFDKEWDFGGCIFADAKNDVFSPSDNVVLYGHSMEDLSMFQKIKRFRNKSFWEEHQYFLFDTIYERHTYQVIACFYATADPRDDNWFPYHQFSNAKNEEQFNNFMANVHARELYSTGLTAEYGDMLLTLSTCERNLSYMPDARLVVIAKRVS